MVTFKCKDIGYNCSFEASAVSTDEVMKKALEHVQKMHGIKEIPPEHIRELHARWGKEKM